MQEMETAEEQERKGELETDFFSVLPFEKNIYQESPEISHLSRQDVSLNRLKWAMEVKGKDPPKPILEWIHSGFPDSLSEILKNKDYLHPTPIQSQTVPAILSGRDVICSSPTGSGEALSFLLPVLAFILKSPQLKTNEGPICLILEPTRETAFRTHQQIVELSSKLGIRASGIIGGMQVRNQIEQLRNGAEIIVSTPGRFLDLLTETNLCLKRLSHVVLDEADRMIDMGFKEQLQTILKMVRLDRQTMIFSSQQGRELEIFAAKFLTKPVEITIKQRFVSNFEQHVEVLEAHRKKDRLLQIIAEWNQEGRIMIVVNRRQICAELANVIVVSGFQAVAVHGGRSLEERDEAVNQYKNKQGIMVATSVGSRGIDSHLSRLIINFDVPGTMEAYIKQLGRSEMIPTTKTAITFVTLEETHAASYLITLLASSGQTISPN